MIPRGKLSISVANLFAALLYCFSKRQKDELVPNPALFGNAIFCLSARTGLNLSLQALNFAPGSQLIACAINIPDMFTIIAAHQLECVPVSIQKHNLGIDIAEIENSITPLTKAILITHLFGEVINMEEVIVLAKKHHLIVIEDGAQAFNFNYAGHPNSDISLFSFGLIKTNTCLSGALICFNNQPLFEKVKWLNRQLPAQKNKEYGTKIFKAFAIKLITVNWVYTLLYDVTLFFKRDFDQVLAGFTKGFPGSNVLAKISFRPSPANLRLLQKRTNRFGDEAMVKKNEIVRRIIRHIPDHLLIGTSNASRKYWVLALESQNPVSLISYFRQNGIDATAKASSLMSLSSDFKSFGGNALNLEKLVFLPIANGVAKKLEFLDLTKYG